MSITIYGIPNCDTMKKARNWLDQHGLEYQFHNYKKLGISADKLESWVAQAGWEALVNRRGTTWRKLDDSEKAALDDNGAIALMQAHTSLIKRPVLEHVGGLLVGFTEDSWASALL